MCISLSLYIYIYILLPCIVTSRVYADLLEPAQSEPALQIPLRKMLGPEGPSKIQEVTWMRPIHGNL